MASLDFTRRFAPVAVATGGAAEIFTMPAAGTFRNGRVRLANVTGGAVTAQLTIGSTVVLPTTSIGANSYLDVDIPLMNGAEVLNGLASAATSIYVSQLSGFIQS